MEAVAAPQGGAGGQGATPPSSAGGGGGRAPLDATAGAGAPADAAAAAAAAAGGRGGTTSATETAGHAGGEEEAREGGAREQAGRSPPDADETAAAAAPDSADPSSTAADRGAGEHGCAHYRRRCRLVAPCCGGKVYWCRHCHDEEQHDGGGTDDPHGRRRHTLDRRSVAEVVCALCGARQPAAPSCRACAASFGRYHCPLCRFWDDDLAKGQWHCDQCGICRVGHASNFFHCPTCASCLSVALRGGHVCAPDATKRACPVCLEYLFDSVRPISVLPRCGHALHRGCLARLLAHSGAPGRCPLCLRAAVAPGGDGDAERAARLDAAVRETAMPAEFVGVRVPVLCNDCGARCEAPFHVVGHKCAGCGGYNTRRV